MRLQGSVAALTRTSGARPVLTDESASTERSVADERAWLVRRCVRLTQCPDAAEDLAHEILLRAYRADAAGAGPPPGAGAAGRRAWIGGGAKHVCADWVRRRQRERSLLPEFLTAPDGTARDLAESPTPFDLEQELGRGELLDLLDRAMRHIPAETRGLLLAHHGAGKFSIPIPGFSAILCPFCAAPQKCAGPGEGCAGGGLRGCRDRSRIW